MDCPAIDGLIEETDETAGEVEDKVMLVAAPINVAGAAGHYEINRYGSLAAWARQLGRADCAQILAQTLEEEKQADRKLTQLAEARSTSRPPERDTVGSGHSRRRCGRWCGTIAKAPCCFFVNSVCR